MFVASTSYYTVWIIGTALCLSITTGGHLGCFYFLAIVNNAVRNILVQFNMDIRFHFPWENA
jgi:hypothetical protein